MARRKKRKGGRKSKARRRKGGGAKRRRSNTIPLPILERRAKKLVKIVRSRGGKVPG